MPARTPRRPADERGRHGAPQLAGGRVDACNLAIRESRGEGFVGDGECRRRCTVTMHR
jgi:hypothetical protein